MILWKKEEEERTDFGVDQGLIFEGYVQIQEEDGG